MEPLHHFAATLGARRYDDRELLHKFEAHQAWLHDRRLARQARQQRMKRWIAKAASRRMRPDVATSGQPSETRIDFDHQGI